MSHSVKDGEYLVTSIGKKNGVIQLVRLSLSFGMHYMYHCPTLNTVIHYEFEVSQTMYSLNFGSRLQEQF